MALKTLELRARRDAFVVFFLGFFMMLTHFLYSQSLAVAGGDAGLDLGPADRAGPRAHAGRPADPAPGRGLAARMALLGAPVMALLFVLFPRIGPLWGVPQDGVSTIGLSNVMRMGSMTEVALDESVAMRIRFEGRPPPPSQMYFRGPVFTRFDGVEWRALELPYALPGSADRQPALTPTGEMVRYEATLEPLRVASVPLLEATTAVEPIEGLRLSKREDLQWLAERPIYERIRLQAEALSTLRPERRRVAARSFERASNCRPASIRARWTGVGRCGPARPAASVDATAFANLVMRHIREGGYDYTLSPGEYGRDAVDEFWLDRKTGFCEHFAAAFVVIMRAAGFPARIVTGYQGSDAEPVDGYYVVRQSSAHAWAEYWQTGTGWVRADPTGAVAPDRIGRSTRLDVQRGLVAGAIAAMSPELFANLRSGWEAVNNRWNQWVLNYTRGQQLDVLKNIGFTAPDWQDLALLLIGTAERARARRRRPGPGSTGTASTPGCASSSGSSAPCARSASPRRRTRRRAPSRRGCAIVSAPQGEPLAAELDALESAALRPARRRAVRTPA